ncbi:GH92 family glycosyl hydrolase [Streptomyces sp. NPDC058319]|uniref:GH92 family glycosyl hydrolase n=1 Tax=unclassified Streptomyces TaxID=2593676 RepID=UPI0036EF8481
MWRSVTRLRPRRPGPRPRRLLAGALALGTVLAGLAPATASASGRGVDPYDAVDQFIGTRLDTGQNKGNSAYGDTYPGATVPFGMVQSSPTTYRSGDGDQKGGYEYTADRLRGFGMTRLSGTGCEGRFSAFDFPVLPYTGELPDGALPVSPATRVTDYYLPFRHDREQARPGYYKVRTDNDVSTELTATTRTAVSRYDFSGAARSALLIDVAGSNNRVFGSQVTVSGNTVSGWVESAAVCDVGGRYRAYFSTTFDRPVRAFGTWQGTTVTPGSATARSTGTPHGAGAYLVFDKGARVTAKSGLSYVSVAGAAHNRDTETRSLGFGQVRDRAARTWREALGTLAADGGGRDRRVTFYTALYHALLHPNVFDDADGRWTGYDGQVHQVARGRHEYVTYSGWDAYRGQAQLVALLFPKVGDDINQSIVDMVRQTGTWPNWPHLNQSQQKMSGDSLQSLLASVDAFGSTHYDRSGALASMKATQSLPATATRRAGAQQYFSTGFLESRRGGAATSTTLEYAVDDFGIAQLARRLGDRDTYRTFMARAQNWQNVFDDTTRQIRPRDRTGFDRGFDLGLRGDQFDQATGYQYGWLVPHNVGTLIEKRGGIARATAELDEHTKDLDAGVYGVTGAYLSNQPSFSMPYVYNWLRRPDRTADVLRRAVTELYGTSPSGLPGNDDLGSLSAWYVWANLGVYPSVYGTADLVVSAPMFDHVRIRSAGTGRTLTLRADGVSRGRVYVAGLRVDGRRTTRSWVDEGFTRRGGTLTFTMARTPGTWGTGAGDVPPSYTDGADARNDIGTTPAGRGDLGSLDLSGNSLSRDRLAAAGAAPGARLPLGATGAVFTWPDTAPGEPDNWIPHGQRIALGGARGTGITFLGLATNGPAQGEAVVEYTDGSTQRVPVGLTDWTPGTDYRFGNVPLVTTEGRNTAGGGSDSAQAKVFATAPVALDPDRRVASVVLPQGSDRGVLHIFDVALTGGPRTG